MCSIEGSWLGKCDSVVDFDSMGFMALYAAYLVRNWARGGCYAGVRCFHSYGSAGFGRRESRAEGVARISEDNSVAEIEGAEGITFESSEIWEI